MNSSENEYSWIWVVLLIFIIFGSFSKWDKVWVEHYYCKSGWVEKTCNEKSMHFSTTVYQVNKDKQMVIGSVNNGSPTTLTKCSVEDSNSWNCTYDDASANFGMRDGEFFQIVYFGSDFPEMRNVAHTTWIMHMFAVLKG